MAPEDRTEPMAEVRRLAQASVDPDLIASQRGRPRRRTRPAILVAISVGGVAGTAARYGLTRVIHVAPGSFPWSTFTINLTGSFALGVLLTFIIERWPPSRYVRPFAAIGFLGAYTTFSTYMTEAVVLANIAALYVLASLFLGLFAVYAGIVVARLLPTMREAP